MSKNTVGRHTNIEIFGNSHAGVITGAPPSGTAVKKQKEKPRGRGYTEKNPLYPFRTWFLGPVLAYNFYEHHLHKIYDHINENSNFFKGDVVLLLAAGEIDCRVHLPKYVSNERSVEDVVNECVTRYHRSLLHLKTKGYKVAAMGAIPSLCDETLQLKMTEHELKNDVSGNTYTRNKIVSVWDEIHSNYCKRDGIPYVSIHKNLTDEKGMTREELYCDIIHLSHEKTIDFWVSALQEAGIYQNDSGES